MYSGPGVHLLCCHCSPVRCTTDCKPFVAQHRASLLPALLAPKLRRHCSLLEGWCQRRHRFLPEAERSDSAHWNRFVFDMLTLALAYTSTMPTSSKPLFPPQVPGQPLFGSPAGPASETVKRTCGGSKLKPHRCFTKFLIPDAQESHTVVYLNPEVGTETIGFDVVGMVEVN